MRAALARHGRRTLALHATTSRPSLERTFLSALFSERPRDIRQAQHEPGWELIALWASRVADDLRPPPRKDLIEAWKKLMQSKLRRRLPLNSTQALHCVRLLEYLVADPPSYEQQPVRMMSSSDLAMAREVLLDIIPVEKSRHHQNLAKALYTVSISGKFAGKVRAPELHWAWLVKTLVRYGGSQEAMRIVLSKWNEPSYATYLTQEDRLVEEVARGLANEGQEQELVELINHADDNGVAYDAGLQEVVVEFFAQRDRVDEAQNWFEKPISMAPSKPGVYKALARMAKRTRCEKWIMPILLNLGQSQPRKKHWDAILQTIVYMGNTAGDVDSMMGHMVDKDGKLSADVNTLNCLLGAAADMKNAALAKEILKICALRDVEPNGESYLQLFRLHLNTLDLMQAKEFLVKAKHFEPWQNDSRPEVFRLYEQLMSQLLQVLARHSAPKFPLIFALLELVEEDQLLLNARTVGWLCVSFLLHDLHYDVADTLSVHSFLYSEEQREVIQKGLISFCLHANTSTSRAWTCYQILYQIFSDMKLERREQLMEEFFKRKRPDMAAQVFGHMRQKSEASIRPNLDTYVRCFEAFGRLPDLDSVQMVHNMLRMDTTLQLNTRLYTALILAYGACGKTFRVLDLWEEITQTPEGPSYASLEAVFWALERNTSFGAKRAREIWAKMQQLDLMVPPAVYNAYIGAIAGGGHEKEIRQLIDGMESVTDSRPDALTLAVAHNALPDKALQENFRKWAEERHGEAYAKLKEAGWQVNEMLLCQFKLSRVMRA
ncbi:hypothetical protein CDD82_4160 [Ophiocordyceps australis]|uniref:Complex I intermediate-associated protein 84, mitochondrial n=1 Tax=Ophiocordyceps australis TaxID=1399860 RepID=A0A2C5Z8M0_9HYPO|nr:hypothetical protein CDD82_4160 [Ophiocordyceps australis]